MIKIYKASAGSGKTFTLVREYLQLLLAEKKDGSYLLDERPDNKHRKILAITFTNKATEEMKKRIVKELDALAGNSGKSPYTDYFVKKFNTTEDKIRKVADIALNQLLQDFTNFNVSTIDTFFQKVLRTFSYESGLTGNYGVELNDEYAIAVGISDMKQSLRFSRSSDSRLLQRWLEQFALEKISAGKSWNIFRTSSAGFSNDITISSFAKELSKEAVKQNREQLVEYLSDKKRILNFLGRLSDEIGKCAAKIKAEASSISLLLDASNADISKNFITHIRKCEGITGLGDIGKINETSLANYCNNPEKIVRKGSVLNDGEKIADSLEVIIAQVRLVRSLDMVKKNIYLLGLLGDIDKNVREFTKDNNVILLSGTNEILKRIINEDDTPFIYERIGMNLEHFLIDEFQDTSRMQWENLLPLLKNSIAGGNDNLVIGDVKQSIYRFRNSDPELLRSRIKQDFAGQFTESGNRLEENTNWRSSANVVKWNNSFFEWLACRLGLSDIYDNVRQNIAPANLNRPGHVAVTGIEVSTADEFSKEAAPAKTIEDIDRLRDRGYELKDIAIITNTKEESRTIIDRILSENKTRPAGQQIDIVSEESLYVGKSAAVRVIVSILALLDNFSGLVETCDTTDPKKSGTKSLPLVLKQYELNRSNGMTPSDAFSAALAADSTLPDGMEGFNSGEYAGLDSIVGQVILPQLPKDLVEANTPYIQAFIDTLTDYMSRYGSNIHSFLKWWNEFGSSISISSPDNVNAIRVMTIHKSKGLEFPCVILPVFNWKFDTPGLEWIKSGEIAELKDMPDLPPLLPVQRTAKPTIFEKPFEHSRKESLTDALNKTYVACTRAADELIIYYPITAKAHESAVRIREFLQTDIPESTLHDNTWELGIPSRKPSDTRKPSGNEDFEERDMPPFRLVNMPERYRFESPDIIDEIRGTKKYQGEVLHRIMCRIRTAADLDNAVRQFLVKGIITQQEADSYKAAISEGIADPKVAPWFAKGNRLLTERTVVNGKGEIYRPDRVVISGSNVTVIDYKFGERMDRKYMRQVKNYMEIIRKSMPEASVEGYIWYVSDKTVVPVV